MIEDRLLPAAAHLTGPASTDLLRTAVGAAGGRLLRARPCHVQYRPGNDVVVRFDATVRWAGGEPERDTLVAAATRDRVLPGTLHLQSCVDGVDLDVGVWRWPFDPVLQGLRDAVTASHAARFLDGIAAGVRTLEVVAYRPCERAVARVTTTEGDLLYLKVVAPAITDQVVGRHAALHAAGVPVPRVLRHDRTRGVIAMAELRGRTLRERLARTGPWPAAGEFRRVMDAFATSHLVGTPVPSRAEHGALHAAMLATVVPTQRHRLDRLAATLRTAGVAAARRERATIHGDLYAAQVVTDGPWITGVLDLDDAGPGDPLDDIANLLGHLLVRAIGRDHDGRIGRYASRLRTELTADLPDGWLGELDLVTAGVVTGLATGPFRNQSRGWAREVARILGVAEQLTAQAGEGTLRIAS